MTYHIVTYGCQMNHSDSERIKTVLDSHKFSNTEKNKADILILNACSIRESAIHRVWGNIHNSHKYKNNKLLIVTGCVLPTDRKKFQNKNIIVLDIKNLNSWPKIIKNILPESKNQKVINSENESCADYLSIAPKHSSTFSALVPIMTGCNNFCSYCAVPYTRGREVSRSPEDIIKEVNKLIIQGYKEIILLGQNVNSYKGKNKNGRTVTFPNLLKKIDTIEGNYWLNFVSSHPKDLSDELINCFSILKHLTPYLHLALQSGSNKILKAMNRRYTISQYKKLIKKLRAANSNISISTDIIVGFPGETKTDLLATKKAMQEIKFDMAYISQFSPRAGTVAARLEDNISKDKKVKRELELTEILKITSLDFNKQFVGQTLDVLIEKKKNNNYFGKTFASKNVKIKIDSKSKTNLVGQFKKIKITKAGPWILEGKLI